MTALPLTHPIARANELRRHRAEIERLGVLCLLSPNRTTWTLTREYDSPATYPHKKVVHVAGPCATLREALAVARAVTR
jgi:hypothetical protein